MSDLFTNLKKQDTATFIVTDSGLGGLSIAAELYERLKKKRYFKAARVIFFNSSFDNHSGYNKLKSHAEKVSIFTAALNSMFATFRPDVIIIGCNTLSVIYPDTPFSKSTTIPVIEIVDIGVKSVINSLLLKNSQNYHIVIFGTPTTITSSIYSRKLIAHGITSSCISEISCSDLADKIEEDNRSEKTQTMVAACVTQASDAINDKGKHLLISLNCTHYGYVANLFYESFYKLGYHDLEIVNPNPEMVDVLFDDLHKPEQPSSETSIEVVSKVSIFPHVMDSIGILLHDSSPATVAAMRHYTKDERLF